MDLTRSPARCARDHYSLGRSHAVSFEAVHIERNLKSRVGTSGVALKILCVRDTGVRFAGQVLIPKGIMIGRLLCNIEVIAVRLGASEFGCTHLGAGAGGLSSRLSGSATTCVRSWTCVMSRS